MPKGGPELRILSLGWGVQSWTLAAMMALDEMPRADLLIHADTTHEHSGTYDFVRRWTPWLGEHGLDVVTVTGSRTEAVVEEWSNSVRIPAFTTARASGKRGQIRRQCTHDWKIMPIRAIVRAELERRGIRRRPGVVESITGISYDEFQRMRDSDVAYIVNSYPLVDRRITRADCTLWLEAHGLEVPPKSACTFCPYHTVQSWKALKRVGGPDWQEAVFVDLNIRDRRGEHQLFVHPYRKPLPEAIVIPEDEGMRQLAFDDVADEQPCDSGHCWT